MSESHPKITIIGAGAWGCAIANLIGKNGYPVTLFSKNQDSIALKKISQKKVAYCFDFKAAVTGADFLFVVVPSKVVSETLYKISQEKIVSKAIIVICSKGIADKDLKLFSQISEELLPQNNYAILSGPNFAEEVNQGLPTVTTIACKQESVATGVIKLLQNDHFLAITSHDVISAQIFGAVKNILAIGCGIIDGLKLGENAKAALILKGVTEMGLLIKKLGGEFNFVSAAGLGDLFLTCSSSKSRNNSLGVAIGAGKKVKEILKENHKVYEGFDAAKAIVEFALKHQIDLPLCRSINQILQQDLTKEEIKEIIFKTILKN